MYRYLPLTAMLSLLVYSGIKGFDYSSTLALLPLAFLAYKFEEKTEKKELLELKTQIKELSVKLESNSVELEEAKTHMASIKLNQGMKRTF